jgi:hypothetical protein
MNFDWLRKYGERIFLGTFAVIAFAGAVLALILGEHLAPLFHERLPAAALILLSTFILVFLFGYERRIMEMSTIMTDCKNMVEQSRAGIAEHVRKWERLGIVDIYRSRDDPGQKQAYIQMVGSAVSDLFIVGVTLKYVTRSDQPMLIEKAANGCSVRLLMLTPARWKNEHPILDPVETGDLKEDFISALRNIRKIASTIAKKNSSVKPLRGRKASGQGQYKRPGKNSFEVRFYDQAPALSMTIADAHLASGRMRVEFTPHNENDKGPYFRPMMDLISREDSLFRQFNLHYNGLWDSSIPYVCVSGSKIYPNSKIDIEVSEMFGMPENWAPNESLVDDNTEH